MQITVLLTLAIMAISTLVVGMPLHSDLSTNLEGPDPTAGDMDFYEDDPTPEVNILQGCGKGYKFCGKCNGTKCKMAGVNLPCSWGTCVKQRGGGDGKICGGPRTGYMICPGW